MDAWSDIPEGALSTHREVLKNEPDSRLTVWVVQLERIDRSMTNEISRVVAARVRGRNWLLVAIGGVRVWHETRRCLSGVVLWLAKRMRCWNRLTVHVVALSLG